jgi:hypothetical protein
MTVYELLIDDTSSLTSDPHSWGLFASYDSALNKLKSMDWVCTWMFVEIKEREVLP